MAAAITGTTNEMENAVIQALQTSGPATALQLSRLVDVDKAALNRILYTLAEGVHPFVFRDTSVPPVWRAQSAEAAAAPLSSVPLAIVDLGNVHDTLRELVPYAQAGLAQVEAFADRAFNGYGVKPALDGVPNLRVHRASGTNRNAADIELVWFLCETLPDATHSPALARQVVVATKDQGYQALRDLVLRRGHTLTFVTEWSEMRDIIE